MGTRQLNTSTHRNKWYALTFRFFLGIPEVEMGGKLSLPAIYLKSPTLITFVQY